MPLRYSLVKYNILTHSIDRAILMEDHIPESLPFHLAFMEDVDSSMCDFACPTVCYAKASMVTLSISI